MTPLHIPLTPLFVAVAMFFTIVGYLIARFQHLIAVTNAEQEKLDAEN